MILKNLAIALVLIFWPTSLFLANTPADFILYLTPTALLVCFCLLYKSKNFFYPAPLVLIPFFEPKLALLPPIFFLAILFLSKNKTNFISLLISLIILISIFPSFKSQTIFYPDHNAYQKVIQDTRLYGNIFEARLMHNKARVYLDKINQDFFALIDPNNYFSAFHPREIIIDNQNLKKFPLFSIIFLGIGLFKLISLKDKQIFQNLFFASVINLSILNIFDRTDFILYLPLSLFIIHGINALKKSSLKASFFLGFFVLVSSVEYLKIFISLAGK